MSYSPGQNYQFRYTLAAALLVHGLLIFGITAGGIASQTQPQNQSLEVIVSVLPSDVAPEQSEFRAAQNQQASGSGDTKEELTTLLQAIMPRVGW